jgi:radical SAM superfamily enzyme YgiQ (UPF0313 family)
MNRHKLLLVNPPSLLEKPDMGHGGGLVAHTELSCKIKVAAMNPGVLSIASYLDGMGHAVKVLDMSNDADYGRLQEELSKGDFSHVGVSSTSGFDYIESLKCIEIAKTSNPSSLTILGGQHGGALGTVALQDSEHLDVVCLYEGEKVARDILEGKSLGMINGIVFRKGGTTVVRSARPEPISLDELPGPKYGLYPNFSRFAPFVEESRGCYARCGYCTSAHMNAGRIRVKSVGKILGQMADAIELWGHDVLYILSAATFGVQKDHMLELVKGMGTLGVKWTTEFRADLPWYDHVDELYEAGLSVAVVGMESASPEILQRMNKTTRPQAYIAHMEEAIARCSQIEDLTLRLNLMVYVGESPKTIRETLGFLARNAHGIDAVLCTPVFINPGTALSSEFSAFERQFGAQRIQSPYWDKRHLHICHPSKHFSFRESLALCDLLEKIYSSEAGWLESEKFHYIQDGALAKSILAARFTRGR